MKGLFEDAFDQIWSGRIENDDFNRLVLRAHLSAREVTILRAYAKYLRQVGSTFSDAYIERALTGNPATRGSSSNCSCCVSTRPPATRATCRPSGG